MLIAAYRVLRRQSVPGHPPCALISLILFGRSYWLLRADMSALNVCRSVVALHTSSPTCFLRFPFRFLRLPFRLLTSVLPLSASVLSLSAFVSFSVSHKVFYSLIAFSCAVFKVRLSVLAFAIPENDTEFHLKNNLILFVGLSPTRMCLAISIRLPYSLFPAISY